MPMEAMNRSRQLPAMLLCALLVGCGPTLVSPPAARCSSLVPEAWKKGVGAIPLPGMTDVGEMLTAFVAQTARVEMADARTADAIGIVERCEAMQNDARPREKVLGIF